MSHYVVDAEVILRVSPLRTALFLDCRGGIVFAGGSITSARRRGDFDGINSQANAFFQTFGLLVSDLLTR